MVLNIGRIIADQHLRGHFSFQRAHVVLGIGHMFGHYLTHTLSIFSAVGFHQLAVVVLIGVIELLAFGNVGFFDHHQVAQHVV